MVRPVESGFFYLLFAEIALLPDFYPFYQPFLCYNVQCASFFPLPSWNDIHGFASNGL
jgi:hypothetical protein